VTRKHSGRHTCHVALVRFFLVFIFYFSSQTVVTRTSVAAARSYGNKFTLTELLFFSRVIKKYPIARCREREAEIDFLTFTKRCLHFVFCFAGSRIRFLYTYNILKCRVTRQFMSTRHPYVKINTHKRARTHRISCIVIIRIGYTCICVWKTTRLKSFNKRSVGETKKQYKSVRRNIRT
jgi:hypothetical protein